MQSWKEKVVVITGGTAGIGKALALASQQAGAQTVVVARSKDGLKAIEEQTDGKIYGVEGDVTEDESIETAIEEVIGKFGRIDIFINNAGISGLNTSVADYPLDEWNKIINLNLNAVFYCCKAVVPYM